MQPIPDAPNDLSRAIRGGLTHITTILRPDDLLNLEVYGINLKLDTSDPANPVLVLEDNDQPALLALLFPPQTVAERAFYDSKPVDGRSIKSTLDEVLQKADVTQKDPLEGKNLDDLEKLQTPGNQVNARMGGPTRLVFRVPASARIPFTLEGLLDWSQFKLNVSPIADVPFGGTPPDAALTIRPPETDETTIEMPYRLHLSPTHDVIWDHAKRAVYKRGRVELWHTRLSIIDENGKPQLTDDEHTLPLRAIWAPEFPEDPLPGEFGSLGALGAMSPSDRKQIVILTSAFRGYAEDRFSAFIPTPIQASLLMLSPLGGWLHSFGVWNPPYKIKPSKPIPIGTWKDWFSRRRIFERGAESPISGVQNLSENEIVEGAADIQDAAVQRDAQFQDGIELILAKRMPFAIPRYDIDEDAQLDLSQWAHIASQGRDHYVRIVYDGKLKWTGHPASLVKVTERRIETDPTTNAPVAYLRQYMYVVVRQPEMDYTKEGLANDGVGMPFKKIRLTTLVTPNITYPYDAPSQITQRSFWVMVEKKHFLFHAVGEDIAGNPIDFTTPLIFVPNSEKETEFVAITNEFNKLKNRAYRNAVVAGQKVTFAKILDGGQNTVFVTQSINFANEGITRENFMKPRLYSAMVHIPAVEQILGTDQPAMIHYENSYLKKKGFDDASNQTGVFAEIVNEKNGELENAGLGLEFNAQQAGGFAVPNQKITYLSRKLGPLGGNLNNALGNLFDPAEVFPDDALIFGSFKLSSLLPKRPADASAPKMNIQRVGDNIITRLDWSSDVKPPSVKDKVVFESKPDSRLTVKGTFTRSLSGASDAEFSMHGDLNNFSIKFLNVVQVNFDLFSFDAQSGKKTKSDVKLNALTPVKFIGDLEFVEELRKLIPPGAFGDGVSIDLIDNPLGLKAGLELSLPDVSVGVFSLKNISFSAGLVIPFLEGATTIDFGFARRDHPFNLTVAFLGGGGFFHIVLDTAGIRELEAAFEFGASAALDIGVASGEVHMMAGIYFKMEKRKVEGFTAEVEVSLLSGYLRIGGSLSVLGLITISVEFNLSFNYISKVQGDSHTGKAFGRATLTVSIEIAFFSTSVKLTVERAFGGESGDPTFRHLIDSPAVWNEYADAFA